MFSELSTTNCQLQTANCYPQAFSHIKNKLYPKPLCLLVPVAGSIKFFLIAQRAFAGDQLEILMKAGKIVEPTLITQLFNAHIVFNEQFTGVTYAHFNEEL